MEAVANLWPNTAHAGCGSYRPTVRDTRIIRSSLSWMHATSRLRRSRGSKGRHRVRLTQSELSRNRIA